MDRHSRCDFRPFALIAVTLALAVTDVGCATRRGPGPGAPPREIPLPTDGTRADEVAELRQALEVYSLSQPAAGQQALEAFIKKHPKSPQVALAAALLARVMLHQGDVIGARALLERRAADSPDPAARFIRGLAEARGGQPQQALALLQPFAEPGPPPLGPEPDEAELSLRAALGDARLATGDVAGAFAEWDHYLRQSNVRESEKAFARQRADEMAARVSPEAAAQAYRSSKSELARAALGPRAAAGLRARGDNDTARSLDEESASVRRSLGFSTGAGGSGPGDPRRLGLLAPFSGPAFLLGEVVLRGAMLAIGEAGRSGEPAQFQIVARDAAEGAGGRAAFELVREEQAIGVVGVGDRRAVEGALADGVPVLLLDEGLPGSGRTAFQVLHTPEARAAELARRALGLGARRFAILAPDTPTGRRLADAFSRAASAQGGRITARASYAAGASAFTGPIGQLKKASFEAVFVAEDARRLELIAPALAAADLWPAPFSGGKPPARAPGAPPRREILLLSPAVGLGSQLLRNAGRYVQGALLAPGFYSDAEDARAGGFVTQYRLLYGQDPGAADAYAYDAFRFMAAAVTRGARSRPDLVRALGSDPFDGVTGQVRFGADHTRADPPPVYLVDGDAIRALR
jgi:branched-chain amino acid transport system substrate-binding protein